MSYAFKILGQAVGDGGLNDIYTVPDETQAIVNKVTIVETSGIVLEYTVAVAPGGEAQSDKHLLANALNLAAKGSVELAKGLTLTEKDVIRFRGSGAGLSCHVWGVEITK